MENLNDEITFLSFFFSQLHVCTRGMKLMPQTNYVSLESTEGQT